TRVGGVPDVVEPDAALLVRPEDPAALAGALRRVYECPAEARDLVEAARGRLDADFRLERWIDRYETVYRQAIAPDAGTSPDSGRRVAWP
ncbi:MAG TPA: hypothetical protein VKA44_00010, partial [Gemmatimonadota bacterium]|nr:hypothetical protein [Gemmatimonadota bacterium]